MKLHIFNPEHDIALAYDKRYQIVPHAAKELRMNLGFIPSLWADDGDCVLVDDVQYAVKASSRCGVHKADVLFLSDEHLKGIVFDEIVPWGWDRCLHTQLQDAGINPDMLPTEEQLQLIRLLSNRSQTVDALSFIRNGIENDTCGENRYCTTLNHVSDMMNEWGAVVVKAPWSSSGRGLRYVRGECSASTHGWIRRTISTQGGVMVEPYYNKVKDFGMEFHSYGDGTIAYCGLSLFDTVNGTYSGNVISDEDYKMKMLGKYVSEELINVIKQKCEKCFGALFRNKYKGPFGVDMMVVARNDAGGFAVHPCVEINLRRTMGHVALSLSSAMDGEHSLMRIIHDVNYQLKFFHVDKYFVKTL